MASSNAHVQKKVLCSAPWHLAVCQGRGGEDSIVSARAGTRSSPRVLHRGGARREEAAHITRGKLRLMPEQDSDADSLWDSRYSVQALHMVPSATCHRRVVHSLCQRSHDFDDPGGEIALQSAVLIAFAKTAKDWHQFLGGGVPTRTTTVLLPTSCTGRDTDAAGHRCRPRPSRRSTNVLASSRKWESSIATHSESGEI
jgi:hypothetical protein